MSAINIIRKTLLRVSEKNVKFSRRKFYSTNFSSTCHLEKVGKYFLIGYHHSLLFDDLTQLHEKLSSIESEFRGFTYEGAAMGMALLDLISVANKSRLKNYIADKGKSHIYMMHVGAGWAYAKLPINVEKQITILDPILKWLVIDGYGFCKAYFKTHKYVFNRQIPFGLSAYAKHAFYQGVGRCLWFVEGTDPRRICSRIQLFSNDYHADLWAGIGLACAYAGGVDRATIEELKEIGHDYLLHLAQGAAFAAKARLLAGNLVPHTEMACEVLASISAKRAAGITDEALEELDDTEREGVPSYEMWRKKIRNQLSKILDKQKLSKVIN